MLRPLCIVMGLVALGCESTPNDEFPYYYLTGDRADAGAPVPNPYASYSTSVDAAATGHGFVLSFGSQGSGPGQFSAAIGIAIDKADNVLVTDIYSSRIEKFDSDGRFITEYPTERYPGAIALDAFGNMYITHFPSLNPNDVPLPGRVTVYDANGKYLRQWGTTGKENGQFDYAGGIAIAPDGNVYVADQTNRRVQVFDSQGTFLGKWGEYGVGPGQFGGNVGITSRVGGPGFIAIDKAGVVYTTEASVGRVQQFSLQGQYVKSWGNNDDRLGGFGGKMGPLVGPLGITLDRNGRVWVTSIGGRVQQFTVDGQFLQGFGERGSGPAQFRSPHGLAFNSRGELFVVDSYNFRVQKFIVSP